MTWKIEYLQSVKKEIRKIDKQTCVRIRDYLENKIANLEDPRDLGKSLKGNFSELWRYRVGDYRIICSLEDNTCTVLVVRIGHRKNIYDLRND